MCTCINLKTRNNYFGRSLDLEYRFREQVVVTPRNYEFNLKNKTVLNTGYAMIGMAMVNQGYPLYADAANEKGLAMAGLNFPGNACFFRPDAHKLNLAGYELFPYFLGQYSTVAEVREAAEKLNITGIPFAEGLPVSELHWMVSDGKDCIILEQMAEGLKIYDNPLMVLTNNPPFDYHLHNLHNYMNLTPRCGENRFSGQLDLKPYGRGMGAIGLPGDASPGSRFVRAAFHKCNSVCDLDEESSVTQFFHILDSVSLVRGSTVTEDGKYDITNYTCCINTTDGIYYYKTYGNSQITAIHMGEKEKGGRELSVFDLVERQQIRYENL